MNAKITSKENMSSCCANCGLNGCCHQDWHGGKYMVLRVLLGLLILAITFAIGLKIGEFKESAFGVGLYGHNMHGYMMQDWATNPRPQIMIRPQPVIQPAQDQTGANKDATVQKKTAPTPIK